MDMATRRASIASCLASARRGACCAQHWSTAAPGPSVNTVFSGNKLSWTLRSPNSHRTGNRFNPVRSLIKRSPKRLKYASSGFEKDGDVKFVTVDEHEIDRTKIEEVAGMLKRGAVGIIPTDTVYSIVCDLKNLKAVERLYRIKNLNPHKPLSILCRSFRDIDTYTFGFPKGGSFGHRNVFREVKHCLPGPYTFILKASKDMPKQCIGFGVSKAARCAPRSSVGVRLPNDAICQSLLSLLDEPLLCTSVTMESEDEEIWAFDPEDMANKYGGGDRGESVDFVLNGGGRGCIPSTVVDFTGVAPLILRKGKGSIEEWMLNPEEDDALVGNPYTFNLSGGSA